MSLTAVTVVANRVGPDGSQPAGELIFTLSEPITNGSETVIPAPVSAPLVGGVATVVLYANDDTGTAPGGSNYRVVETVDGAPVRTDTLTIAHGGPNPLHI